MGTSRPNIHCKTDFRFVFRHSHADIFFRTRRFGSQVIDNGLSCNHVTVWIRIFDEVNEFDILNEGERQVARNYDAYDLVFDTIGRHNRSVTTVG